MENKIINGGAGSGDFGHAGREGLVGGSEPVESRKSRGFKSKSERKEVKKEESKNKYHNFLEYKINESWYKNAKQDYGVDGKLLDTSLKDDTLTIKWEEKEPNKDKKQYKMEIPYASDYSNEQLYAIWQDQSSEVEEIKKLDNFTKYAPDKEKLKQHVKEGNINSIKTMINEQKKRFEWAFGKDKKEQVKKDLDIIYDAIDDASTQKISYDEEENLKGELQRIEKYIDDEMAKDYSKEDKSTKAKYIGTGGKSTDKKPTQEVKKEEKQERAEQMKLFNGKKANNSLYKHEYIEY